MRLICVIPLLFATCANATPLDDAVAKCAAHSLPALPHFDDNYSVGWEFCSRIARAAAYSNPPAGVAPTTGSDMEIARGVADSLLPVVKGTR